MTEPHAPRTWRSGQAMKRCRNCGRLIDHTAAGLAGTCRAYGTPCTPQGGSLPPLIATERLTPHCPHCSCQVALDPFGGLTIRYTCDNPHCPVVTTGDPDWTRPQHPEAAMSDEPMTEGGDDYDDYDDDTADTEHGDTDDVA
jgi:hypothetical protein